MKVSIFGTGYVGLVTGTCFAEMGNDVLCVDIDEAKVEALRKGHIPIFEPGLEDLVTANVAKQNLQFSTDIAAGVDHGDIIFIAVGTPEGEDGSAGPLQEEGLDSRANSRNPSEALQVRMAEESDTFG